MTVKKNFLLLFAVSFFAFHLEASTYWTDPSCWFLPFPWVYSIPKTVAAPSYSFTQRFFSLAKNYGHSLFTCACLMTIGYLLSKEYFPKKMNSVSSPKTLHESVKPAIEIQKQHGTRQNELPELVNIIQQEPQDTNNSASTQTSQEQERRVIPENQLPEFVRIIERKIQRENEHYFLKIQDNLKENKVKLENMTIIISYWKTEEVNNKMTRNNYTHTDEIAGYSEIDELDHSS